MKMKLFGILLLFVQVAQIRGSDDTTRRYDLPEHGSILMKVPSEWKSEIGQPPGALPPTIRFSAAADPQFRVMITPIWQAKADKPLPDGAAVRELVQKSADQVQSQASNKIEIKELKGGPGAGYYFLAIDPAPKPGEWKYMTQGVLRVGDLMVTFTILTNDGQEAVIKSALEMLKGATRLRQN